MRGLLALAAVVFVVLRPELGVAGLTLLVTHARFVSLSILVALGLDTAVSVVRIRHRRQQARTLQGLLELTPSGFEEAVASLLRALGYRHVKVTGGAGDLGADITCRAASGEPVVVQCKRWAPGHRVGSAVLQAFIGMVYVQHRAARGLVVTTSSFTSAARALARRHRIELIDGSSLADVAQPRHRRARLSREQSNERLVLMVLPPGTAAGAQGCGHGAGVGP